MGRGESCSRERKQALESRFPFCNFFNDSHSLTIVLLCKFCFKKKRLQFKNVSENHCTVHFFIDYYIFMGSNILLFYSITIEIVFQLK